MTQSRIPKINRGAILRAVEQPHIKVDAPDFQAGDTVRVETKVVEGTRTRLQALSPSTAAAAARASPSARSRSARVWSACFPTAPR
jgi:Ribosomal protein L19